MNRSSWLEVARLVVVAVLVFAYAPRWVPIDGIPAFLMPVGLLTLFAVPADTSY